MTPQQLLLAMPYAGERASIYAQSITDAMQEFHIDTPARQAAFLAQVAHESGSLKYVLEIADGSAYEGRKDLGNTFPGDGVRFRGRGLLQITGRTNYGVCGIALGVDLLNFPERLEEPVYASRSAGWFWSSRFLNAYADQNKFGSLTKAINGGYIGLDDRIICWLTTRKALGL